MEPRETGGAAAYQRIPSATHDTELTGRLMFLRSVLEVLRTILYGWVVALVRMLRALFGGRRDPRSERDKRASRSPCVPIADPAFVRPDPLIYSQQRLMALGLAVTWDNPDIVLYRHGVPVASHELVADTDYEVRARCWRRLPNGPSHWSSYRPAASPTERRT